MTSNKANIEARANLIRLMNENTANLKSRDTKKIISVGNAQRRTCQTHCQATLICPTEVIIKSRYAIIRKALGKKTLSDYAKN